MNEVGIRLDQLLKALNTTQLRLARDTGLSQPFISSIILGKKDISRDVLEKLAIRHPEVNLNWLLVGTGTMFNPNVGEVPDANQTNFVLPATQYTKNVLSETIPDDAELRKTLAGNLARLAKRWDLKKIELADRLVPGVKKPTVTNYFSGQSQIPLNAMLKLEEATGIGISTWLLNDISEMEFPIEPLKHSMNSARKQLDEVRQYLREALAKLK